ncbi:hypothetical protein V490_02806 [Pseudogymnoascus sp. VKM F-3557]|nr:hypothetical protein V490_02806 [Pseudogymnoascus sp. VKM F-3557]
MSGFLTVLGESKAPAPTMFQFPSRHHAHSSRFSTAFIEPTGLHPTLKLSLGSSQPPKGREGCRLNAHLNLPRSVFPDKYQFRDALYLADKNLSALHHVTLPVDLEAPEYTMALWGSSLLVELAPPAASEEAWTAEIPLHLRYLLPTESGYSTTSLPAPEVFWACDAGEDSKLTVNPFDRVNLGYEGLFGEQTLFYHLKPEVCEAYDPSPANTTYTKDEARDVLLDQENEIEFFRHRIALLKFPAELGIKFTSFEFVTGGQRRRHSSDIRVAPAVKIRVCKPLLAGTLLACELSSIYLVSSDCCSDDLANLDLLLMTFLQLDLRLWQQLETNASHPSAKCVDVAASSESPSLSTRKERLPSTPSVAASSESPSSVEGKNSYKAKASRSFLAALKLHERKERLPSNIPVAASSKVSAMRAVLGMGHELSLGENFDAR